MSGRAGARFWNVQLAMCLVAVVLVWARQAGVNVAMAWITTVIALLIAQTQGARMAARAKPTMALQLPPALPDNTGTAPVASPLPLQVVPQGSIGMGQRA